MQNQVAIIVILDFLLLQCKRHYGYVIHNVWQSHITQRYALRKRSFIFLHTDYMICRLDYIVFTDFYRLRCNAFPCTRLPLLVMSFLSLFFPFIQLPFLLYLSYFTYLSFIFYLYLLLIQIRRG